MVDHRVAFAAEIADVRRGTAAAIMKLEKELEKELDRRDGEKEKESAQTQEWLMDLGCLKNKLKREERHLNMVLDAVFAEVRFLPSYRMKTNTCTRKRDDDDHHDNNNDENVHLLCRCKYAR